MSSSENITGGTFQSSGVFISDEVQQGFSQFQVWGMSVLCVSGVASNIINIRVLSHLDMRETVNISFMGLAVSDLCACLTLLWTSVCLNPEFQTLSDLPWNFRHVQVLTGGRSHSCFARITAVLTAQVTFERCLAVLLPLTFRRFVSPRRVTFTTVAIFCFVLGLTYIPQLFAQGLAYQSSSYYSSTGNSSNSISPSVVRFINYRHYRFLATFARIATAVIQLSSLVLTAVFTAVLAQRLSRQAKWRQSAAGTKSTDNNKNDSKDGKKDKCQQDNSISCREKNGGDVAGDEISVCENQVEARSGFCKKSNNTYVTKDSKKTEVKTDNANFKSGNQAAKDARVIKMIVTVSTVFIITYFPTTVLVVAMEIVPGLSATGLYKNLVNLLWMVVETGEIINCGSNTFIYYNFSSRFRQAFHDVMACRTRDSTKGGSKSSY